MMSLSFSERLSIEAVKNRILDIFLSFGIHEDFRLNEPSTSPRASNKLVLDSFVDYVKEKKLNYSSNRRNTAISSGSPVELDCLLWLICEFHSYEGIYFYSNLFSYWSMSYFKMTIISPYYFFFFFLIFFFFCKFIF